MDVDRSIRVAVDTGDVTLGFEKSIQSLKLGKGQLVIVAANTPKDIVEDKHVNVDVLKIKNQHKIDNLKQLWIDTDNEDSDKEPIDVEHQTKKD